MGDESIQQTNEDATVCKRSAVEYGYWQDKYIQHLCRHTERRTPEIHLGYFTRVTGLRLLFDRAVSHVLESVDDKAKRGLQVVNLGAGFDTLYWRLKDENRNQGLTHFVDVDFPGVTAKKCALIKRSKVLLEKLASDDDGEVKLSRTDLHARDYHIVAADLSNTAQLEAKLGECGVDFGRPTVFLAECVLVYMEPEAAAKLLKWATAKFTSALVFLDHEQVNMGDRFGQVMLENLAARGCGLPGAASCKDKQTQSQRFLDAGWSATKCWTMNEVYSQLPRQLVDRVEQLELFDERELMQQLFEHYCISVAWRDADECGSFGEIEHWF